jgi:hypothetical protein
MSRVVALAIGIAMLLGAGLAVMADNPPVGLWLLVVGGLITIGTVFERVTYKRVLSQTPGAGWTRTGERFIDPESGKTVDVFYNEASGERRYVDDKAPRKVG